MRTLLVRERVVPAARASAYSGAWRQVVYTARMHGIEAWVFRSASSEDHYLEFIEWKSDDVQSGPGAGTPPVAIADALGGLDMIAPALDSGAWQEWKEWRE